MFADSELEFIEVEELKKTKAELLVRLEATTKLQTEEEEYFNICTSVLKDYKEAIEKFNKEIEKTISYVENAYDNNIIGVNNRYLVDLQLHLKFIQKDENKFFEETEDKTWRMDKKRNDVIYMFNAKYELEKGLSKERWR